MNFGGTLLSYSSHLLSTNVPSWSLSLTQALVNLQGFLNSIVFASV
jgi:hypothetical protein